jgi:CelD/BcsL family acetyltransferase involved in cellulose biosynthesis
MSALPHPAAEGELLRSVGNSIPSQRAGARLVQFREIPRDANFRRQWNALVEKAKGPEIFFTWEWACAVEKAYGDVLKPWLFVVQNDNGSLAGLAAFATDESGREVSFLGATTGDYCDVLGEPSCRGEVISSLLAECATSKARITLANLPADSATVAALHEAAHKHGYYVHARPAYECAQVSLRTEPEREQVRANLRRKKIRRLVAAMDEKASPQLQHLSSWQQVEGELEAFADAHVARFRAMGRRSNLEDARRRRFLTELGRQLSESGWLRLSRFQAGGKSVAWNYGFQFAGSWFWYQPTFDTGLEQFSPGVYLLAKIIGEACEDPAVTRVDLGLGAEGYKERFANDSRHTLHVTLTRSLPGHLRGMIRYRASERLRKWPTAKRVVRSVWGKFT